MKTLFMPCCLAALLGAMGSWSMAPLQAAPPNVVLFLIDDLGAKDLSCEGSASFRTPNIDRLAATGTRFTCSYSACTVCSPTRAALLTGKYPARLHITDWIPGHAAPQARLLPPDWTMHLPLSEVTLAERLKSAGYATCHVGKWHLGDAQHSPIQQGFAFNLGGANLGQPPSYFDPYKIPTLSNGKRGDYLTDRLTDEAVEFIKAHREGPFFLSFWHYAVHTPLAAKPEMIDRVKRQIEPEAAQQNAVYGAMVESVDESVGRVVATLAELKLSENTLVVFTSDNGGLTQNKVTSNRPLREGKGTPYEGGHRIPLILNLPGVVGKGITNATPVMTIDLAPTIVALAGLPALRDKECDGVNLAPLWKEGGRLERESLYWHYPHYHPNGAAPYGAIRSGDFKLIEYLEDGRLELFNLRIDEGEQLNLAQTERERANALHEKLVAWRMSVGAQMPTPNPKYRATENKNQKGKAKSKQAESQ